MKKQHLLTILFCTFLLVLTTQVQSQEKKTNIKTSTIYWDASYSMKNRNITKEFQFLERYFKKYSNVLVNLVVFSTEDYVQKTYAIQSGNWQTLKTTLQNVVYDGIALFDVLQQETKADELLIFTDGNTVLDDFILPKNIPYQIITTSKNTQNLERDNYTFVSLNTSTTKSTSKNINKLLVKRNKNHLFKGLISGTVYDIDGVLIEATVKIKNTNKYVLTDAQGNFNIKAKKGAILNISYVGKQQQEIKIEDNENLIVFLNNDKNTLLDEVVVNSNLTKEEELIDIGFDRKIDKKRISYNVKVLRYENFNKGAYTLTQALRGKIQMRGGGSINYNSNPLIILDGLQFSRGVENESKLQTRPLNFIDPETVAKVTILNGLAATTIYGSEGSDGVILVTTKAFVAFGKSTKKPINTALLKDNTYTEKTESVTSPALYKINYIKELEKQQTFQKMYLYYLQQRKNYSQESAYFINVADYIFLWGNKNSATKVLTNLIEKHPKDVSLLRLVAYKLEEQQNYFLAKRIYKKILRLRTKEAQSYRDVAHIYTKTGEYQQAFVAYKKILNNKHQGVDFTGLKKILTNEFKRLIGKKGKDINTLGVSKNYKLRTSIKARIVVEWSNKDAEFEIQFVNPQKKFFSWKHTKDSNGLRLFNEKRQGYNTEEFLLDNSNLGEWIINIENKNPLPKKPIAIKYTVYKNYGEVNETIQTKVVLLNNITKKQTLSKIVL